MDRREEIMELIKEADPDNPLQFVHDIVKEYSIEKLNHHITSCEDCDICTGCKTVTYGNPNASVLIIGDSVLEDQVKEKRFLYPFEDSESGEILGKVLDMLHVNNEELFFVNAVNCWPHKQVGNELVKRTPHKKEVKNCFAFVKYSIEVVQPRVILLLGSIASNLFYKEAITKIRGNWIEVMGIQAMPTYHPGYFKEVDGKKDEELIDQAKWEFYEDIKKVFQYVQENFPENAVLTAPIE